MEKNYKINLDEIERYKEIDSRDILKTIESFPEQLEESLKICKSASIKKFKPDNIAIFGMGGSGIGGELFQALISDRIEIPVVCFHNYDLPKFINEKSLAFMISYSGNTEETLRAYDKAKKTGARIIAITSGSKLLEKSLEDGFDYFKITGGYQPRAALGFLFLPLLYGLYKINLIDDPEEEILQTIALLKRIRDKFKRHIPVSENSAKKLAMNLSDRIPLIYSSQYYLDPAAKRWKCQINENAKVLAYNDSFPELCHNTICGWSRNSESSNYCVIILKTKNDDNSIKTRISYLKEIIEEKGNIVEEIVIEGKNKPEEIFTAVYTGDFVSVYLGLLRGADPFDIERINSLKRKL